MSTLMVVYLIHFVLPYILAPLGKHCKNVIEVNRETGMECSTITAPSLVNETCNNLHYVLIRFSADHIFHSFGVH